MNVIYLYIDFHNSSSPTLLVLPLLLDVMEHATQALNVLHMGMKQKIIHIEITLML